MFTNNMYYQQPIQQQQPQVDIKSQIEYYMNNDRNYLNDINTYNTFFNSLNQVYLQDLSSQVYAAIQYDLQMPPSGDSISSMYYAYISAHGYTHDQAIAEVYQHMINTNSPYLSRFDHSKKPEYGTTLNGILEYPYNKYYNLYYNNIMGQQPQVQQQVQQPVVQEEKPKTQAVTFKLPPKKFSFSAAQNLDAIPENYTSYRDVPNPMNNLPSFYEDPADAVRRQLGSDDPSEFKSLMSTDKAVYVRDRYGDLKPMRFGPNLFRTNTESTEKKEPKVYTRMELAPRKLPPRPRASQEPNITFGSLVNTVNDDSKPNMVHMSAENLNNAIEQSKNVPIHETRPIHSYTGMYNVLNPNADTIVPTGYGYPQYGMQYNVPQQPQYQPPVQQQYQTQPQQRRFPVADPNSADGVNHDTPVPTKGRMTIDMNQGGYALDPYFYFSPDFNKLPVWQQLELLPKIPGTDFPSGYDIYRLTCIQYNEKDAMLNYMENIVPDDIMDMKNRIVTDSEMNRVNALKKSIYGGDDVIIKYSPTASSTINVGNNGNYGVPILPPEPNFPLPKPIGGNIGDMFKDKGNVTQEQKIQMNNQIAANYSDSLAMEQSIMQQRQYHYPKPAYMKQPEVQQQQPQYTYAQQQAMQYTMGYNPSQMPQAPMGYGYNPYMGNGYNQNFI